jgi:hypothetical protein
MEDEGGCLPDRVIEVHGTVVASLGLYGIIQVSVQVPMPVLTSNVLCTQVFRVPHTVQCCGSKSRLLVESRSRFLMTKNSSFLLLKNISFFIIRPP